MKNWVYHPWKFQRRTEYITPEYFKEEPGISPFGYFNEDRVYHPRICQRRTVYVPPKQLTGDNPVKNRQTRRQPWKKTINGRQPGKKQTDKETTLEKNN
jgi:hypothetical protein